MVIYEFVVVSGSNWEGFVHFLRVCFDVAIGNFLSSSLTLQTDGDEIFTEKSSFVVFCKIQTEKCKLVCSGWYYSSFE